MNTKRQTVWLVSMLSLMVVLSAYYLFTEDASKLDVATDNAHTQDIKVDTQNVTGGDAQATQTSAGASGQSKDAAGKTSTGKDATGKNAAGKTTTGKDATGKDATSSVTGKTATSAATTGTGKSGTDKASAGKTDEQVLKQLDSQSASGADAIAAMANQRNDQLSKQTENLMTIIADSKTNNDAMNKAYDDLTKIEESQAKMENLEDSLSKTFHNVFVQQDSQSGKWQITVATDKLERGDADVILQAAIKELNVQPGQIIVQRIAP